MLRIRNWVLIPKRDIYINPITIKVQWTRQKMKEKGRLRAEWLWGMLGNAVFCKWHGCWTHELSMTMAACTRTGQDQSSQNSCIDQVHNLKVQLLTYELLAEYRCWKKNHLFVRVQQVVSVPCSHRFPFNHSCKGGTN